MTTAETTTTTLRARTQEINAEYWAVREVQSERVAVAQLTLALARAEAAAPPGLRICGVTSNSGPNDEPLACGYPPNPAGQPMHRHSWATLPTWTPETFARLLPYWHEGNEQTCLADAVFILAALAEPKGDAP